MTVNQMTANQMAEMMRRTVRRHLEGSRIISWMWRRSQSMNRAAQRLSRRFALAMGIPERVSEFKAAPLRVGGAMVITAVVTNLLCLWLWKEVSAAAMLWRVAFLCLGSLGLRNASAWDTVKQESALLTRLQAHVLAERESHDALQVSADQQQETV